MGVVFNFPSPNQGVQETTAAFVPEEIKRVIRNSQRLTQVDTLNTRSYLGAKYVTSFSASLKPIHNGENKDKSLEKGVMAMSDNDFSSTLFQDIKADSREREERTRREISDREQRFENQLEKYAIDAVAREERFIAESKERELRISATLEKLDSKIDTHAVHIESMKNQNWWGNVAMFGGMLAIVITLIVALVIAL